MHCTSLGSSVSARSVPKVCSICAVVFTVIAKFSIAWEKQKHKVTNWLFLLSPVTMLSPSGILCCKYYMPVNLAMLADTLKVIR